MTNAASGSSTLAMWFGDGKVPGVLAEGGGARRALGAAHQLQILCAVKASRGTQELRGGMGSKERRLVCVKGRRLHAKGMEWIGWSVALSRRPLKGNSAMRRGSGQRGGTGT